MPRRSPRRKAGFQTAIHAIGDRANRVVMDTFERVQREVPGARALRMRNEHAQILDRAEIPRFASLNVIASMQPTHATSDMPWVPARIGRERTEEGAYVWRKLIASGATIASGSDFPVELPNPMLGFYAAITRQDPSGRPATGWMPDERMSRDEALASFTRNAAFAAHAETLTGSLESGKLADFVVLSKDIMRVAAAGDPHDHGAHDDRRRGDRLQLHAVSRAHAAGLSLSFLRLGRRQALQVMPNVDPFPGSERRIEPGVDGQVPLPSHGPRGEVVEGADCRRSQHHAVDGCLEDFAAAGAQKRQWVARLARQEGLFAHALLLCKGHAFRLRHAGAPWPRQWLC